MKTKTLLLAVIVFTAVILISFPVRDLAADYYYRRVSDILDDKTTEELDVPPISEKTLPAFFAAIDSLQTAAAIAPSRSLYQMALANLYIRLGKWSEVMQALKTPLPARALSGKEAADKALVHLRQAVALEPTNPDFHLALGQLYDQQGGDPQRAAAEIKKAIAAFPVNAPLRYAAAMHYLLTGRRGDALEQARVLAKIDDSYILRDPEHKTDLIERQTPGYIAMLTGSYLYSALEIAWRASRDPEVVKGIAPDTPAAAPVVQLFLTSRHLN